MKSEVCHERACTQSTRRRSVFSPDDKILNGTRAAVLLAQNGGKKVHFVRKQDIPSAKQMLPRNEMRTVTAVERLKSDRQRAIAIPLENGYAVCVESAS